MITTQNTGIEWLERAVGYTRGVLAEISPADLARTTPCRAWSLEDLLAHMDDALQAFTEAATGSVRLVPSPASLPTDESGRHPTAAEGIPIEDDLVAAGQELPILDRLRTNACTLLGAWAAGPDRPDISIGLATVSSSVLIGAAALEITVHGWDVARTITPPHLPVPQIPEALAAPLLELAGTLVSDADRGRRFDAAIPISSLAPYDERLLAYLGRFPRLSG